MLFNSPQYLIFLPVAFLAYFVVGQRHRWLVLLFVSLIFYAFLQAPYLLGALGGVTVVSYVAGRRMAHAGGSHRRRIMQAAVAANLLLLFLMRYLPLLTARAWPAGRHLVTIGVSYYVFQAISYVVDIYMEVEPPEPHFGHFALYLAFFPKLLQGPIERAGSLLPQLKSLEVPSLDRFRSGIMLIVGGLFKKMVIADRLGLVVDPVFLNVRAYSGPIYLLAIYGYALQIYFDFSGYTDIALGTARLFNIELTPNFNAPYMARNIAEFWRRWHISFSRWILDYIFKPLQIQWRDGGKWGSAAALLVTFLLSGLWHGATWGFLIWGGLHGLYLGVSLFYKSRQKKLHATLGLAGSPALAAWQVFFTFNLVSLAWLFLPESRQVV